MDPIQCCFPDAVVSHILEFLPGKEVAQKSLVCKQWADVVFKHQTLWQNILKNEFPGQKVPNNSNSKTCFKSMYINEHMWRFGECKRAILMAKHTDMIDCVQFIDAQTVATGSWDATVRIWDLKTQQVVRVLEGHSSTVLCLHYHNGMLVSGSSDRTICIWDVKSGKCLEKLIGHNASIDSVQIDDQIIVSGSIDGTVRVWYRECRNHTNHCVLQGNNAAYFCVAFNERVILGGGENGMLDIWEQGDNCTHVAALPGHEGKMYCMDVHENRVITGSEDCTVRIWDLDRLECITVLHGHHYSVSCLCVDGVRIVSGSNDSSIRVWDLESGQCYRRIMGQGFVIGLAVSGRVLVYGSLDCGLRILRLGQEQGDVHSQQ